MRAQVRTSDPADCWLRRDQDSHRHQVDAAAQRRPIIPVDVAGRAVLSAFDSRETGQAFLLQAGRDVMVYNFRGIPGPLDESGNPARPADPTGIPTGTAEPPPA